MTAELREPNTVDQIEMELRKLNPIDLPQVHSFTPGVYMRQIFMPAGSFLTSMRHRTRHHFIILKGRISVVSDNEKITYVAPHMGITEPGTKRVLFAHEDTVWVTFHANPDNETDPDEIVEAITDPLDNPLITDPNDHRFNIWRKNSSTSLVLDFTEKSHLE